MEWFEVCVRCNGVRKCGEGEASTTEHALSAALRDVASKIAGDCPEKADKLNKLADDIDAL